MEETVVEAGSGLMVWSILTYILLIVLIYFAFKIYKLTSNYLKLKTKYIKKKLEE